MGNILLILILFGGLILIFGIGRLVGHILKIDKYINPNP